MALRAVVGVHDLDSLWTEKERIAKDLEDTLKPRAAEFGIQIRSISIKDLILPGEMRDLMNKVIEARKAADANLIMQREKTAARRIPPDCSKTIRP